MFIKTFKYIIRHPLVQGSIVKNILRYFKWHVTTRLDPTPRIVPFIHDSRYIIWRGLSGVTSNYYCGLAEFKEMGFLLHFLRETDLFVDIGANVGSYTLLASKVIGANSITIEPIPSTKDILSENIKINDIESKVTILNIGVGSKKDVLKFTRSLDTVNHVASQTDTDTVEIPVERLDDILVDSPNLIKIDVEGFELEAIRGMEKILYDLTLKAIIIELRGLGEKFGLDDAEVHQILQRHGFSPYDYNPLTRELIQRKTFHEFDDYIYIRDFEFVNDRLQKASKIKVLNKEF